MTNQEKIQKMNTYDLFLGINLVLQSSDYMCIMEILRTKTIRNKTVRCALCYHDCGECLQKWLNEEAE